MAKFFKILSNLLCAIFIIAAVFGAGSALYLGGKNNGWFDDLKKPDTEQMQLDNDENKPADGKLSVIPMNTKTMRLAATPMAASANDGIATYSAGTTVSVTNAINIYTYEWSLSSGGSTYVELSSTTGTSVTVSAKQAFSTPITLTCNAVRDGVIVSSATCTLDYYKRPTGLTINGQSGYANGFYGISDFTNEATMERILQVVDLNFAPVFGEGTVEYGDYLFMLRFSVQNSKFSCDVGARSSISFAELFYRYAYDKTGDLSTADRDAINQFKNGTAESGLVDFLCNMFGFKDIVIMIECDIVGRDVTTLSCALFVPDGLTSSYSLNVSTNNVIL